LQARERQAKKRQRYSKGQGSRPGAAPVAAAPSAPQQQQQQEQQQQQRQQQPVQQPQQPKQAPAQQNKQQQGTTNTKRAVDVKPGSKRSADTLHGYGAVLAQQQEHVQAPVKTTSKPAAAAEAAASAPDGRPKKRPNIAETAGMTQCLYALSL
jgi:hypothetical protein